jgi:hypothetical protein
LIHIFLWQQLLLFQNKDRHRPSTTFRLKTRGDGCKNSVTCSGAIHPLWNLLLALAILFRPLFKSSVNGIAGIRGLSTCFSVIRIHLAELFRSGQAPFRQSRSKANIDQGCVHGIPGSIRAFVDFFSIISSQGSKSSPGKDVWSASQERITILST